MPRVLTSEWHRVPASDRPEALRRWRARRDHLSADGVRHWLFASAADPEAILEFIEAGDAVALRQARVRAGLSPDAQILTEVELR